MAFYDYMCLDCKAEAEGIKGEPLTTDEETEVIFETSHGFTPTPKELKEATTCPRCGGTKVERVYRGGAPICYIRGNGYLDKAGCHRDMNLHKLTTDDPYAEMREVGEADDLALRLKRAGQHNPRPQYFPPANPEKEAAEFAKVLPPPDKD